MPWKPVLLAIALVFAGPTGHAPAQSINADLSLGGGTGIGRHAAGFEGSMGDPEIYPGPRDPAWPGIGRTPGAGMPGGAQAPAYQPTGPGGYGAPNSSRPMEFYAPGPGR